MEKTLKLKLDNLNCTSCALNIDLTLEDLPGVVNSSTNYYHQESTIIHNNETNEDIIIQTIESLGYKVVK